MNTTRDTKSHKEPAKGSTKKITLGRGFSLFQVEDHVGFREIASKLNNARARDEESIFLRELDRNETEIWQISRDGSLIGLVFVSVDPPREIEDILGLNDEPMQLDREAMLELMHVFHASAGDLEEFERRGVFNLFVENSNLAPDILTVESRTFKVWGVPGDVVIHDYRDHWSRFRIHWENDSYTPSIDRNCLETDTSELIGLLINYPDLSNLIRKHQPPIPENLRLDQRSVCDDESPVHGDDVNVIKVGERTFHVWGVKGKFAVLVQRDCASRFTFNWVHDAEIPCVRVDPDYSDEYWDDPYLIGPNELVGLIVNYPELIPAIRSYQPPLPQGFKAQERMMYISLPSTTIRFRFD